jgi:hypothetical protein
LLVKRAEDGLLPLQEYYARMFPFHGYSPVNVQLLDG